MQQLRSGAQQQARATARCRPSLSSSPSAPRRVVRARAEPPNLEGNVTREYREDTGEVSVPTSKNADGSLYVDVNAPVRVSPFFLRLWLKCCTSRARPPATTHRPPTQSRRAAAWSTSPSSLSPLAPTRQRAARHAHARDCFSRSLSRARKARTCGDAADADAALTPPSSSLLSPPKTTGDEAAREHQQGDEGAPAQGVHRLWRDREQGEFSRLPSLRPPPPPPPQGGPHARCRSPRPLSFLSLSLSVCSSAHARPPLLSRCILSLSRSLGPRHLPRPTPPTLARGKESVRARGGGRERERDERAGATAARATTTMNKRERDEDERERGQGSRGTLTRPPRFRHTFLPAHRAWAATISSRSASSSRSWP
jgi:hypothetical protein